MARLDAPGFAGATASPRSASNRGSHRSVPPSGEGWSGPGAGSMPAGMSAAYDSRDTRAVEFLLAHCAALAAAGERNPQPVFERLRELLGADLTRLLLFGLAGHRARSRELSL